MFASVPRKFGTYTIEGPARLGKPGTTWKAVDFVTDRGPHFVALKILPHFEQHPQREQRINQFLKQADALSRLRHPRLCQVLDFGTQEGRPYLAMEWIDAPALSDRLEVPQPWEAKTALQMIRQLTYPLEELHSAGCIHGDLKPENIRLSPDHGPMLVDLGTQFTADLSDGSAEAASPSGMRLYASPEQLSQTALTPASNVFSLGVLLYQLLSGRMPFEGGTVAEVSNLIQFASPLPASMWNRRVPPMVDAFLGQVLAKSPAARPASMEVLRIGLDTCLRQADQLAPAPVAAVSLADFSAQLERSLPGTPPSGNAPVQFTTEGGIVPSKPAGPPDLFGTVAPVTRQPTPARMREPAWLQQRRQMQKRTEQVVQQLAAEERQRRQLREQEERARRRTELEAATPDQLRTWCIQYPGESLVRSAYLQRRTPEQAALDRTEVGRAAKNRRAVQGLLLGGLLGLVLGGLIGCAVGAAGPWGWAGGAAAGGVCLGLFGGLGGGGKGAAGAGSVGAGLGAAGGLAGGLPLLIIPLLLAGCCALLFGLLGAWISGGTAAKDWAELGPLPPSAFSLPLDQARRTYLEG